MRMFAFIVVLMLLGITLVCDASDLEMRGGEEARVVSSIPFATACGPVACYSALKWNCIPCDLTHISSECNWQEGKLTSLETLVTVLRQYSGVQVEPVAISPSQLVSVLKKQTNDKSVAVILAVRSTESEDSIDHVVTAVQERNGVIIALDYPEGNKQIAMAELVKIWDGTAIVVSKKTVNVFAVAFEVGVILVIVLGIWIVLQYLTKRVQAAKASFGKTLLVGVAIGMTLFVIHESASGQSVGFQSHEFDFGIVPEKVVVEHDFIVENTSKQAMNITKVQVSCQACTKVDDYLKTIAPGTSGVIRVKLDTAGKHGICSETVLLSTDNSQQALIPLVLKGAIRGMWLSTSALDFNDLGMKDGQTDGEIVVLGAGLPNAKVLEVRADGPVGTTFDASHSNDLALPPGCVYLGKVKVHIDLAKLKPGSFISTISVKTNDPECPTLLQKVTGFYRGAIDLEPSSVYFGSVQPNKSVERVCKINFKEEINKEKIAAIVVSSDFPGLSGAVEWDVVSSSAVLKLKISNSGNQKGLFKGEIRAKYDGKILFVIEYTGYLSQL